MKPTKLKVTEGGLVLISHYNIMYILGLLDAKLKVSKSTLSNWMKEDFSDIDVSPHLTDYCPTCFEYKTSLQSLQIKMNMLKVWLGHIPTSTY